MKMCFLILLWCLCFVLPASMASRDAITSPGVKIDSLICKNSNNTMMVLMNKQFNKMINMNREMMRHNCLKIKGMSNIKIMQKMNKGLQKMILMNNKMIQQDRKELKS